MGTEATPCPSCTAPVNAGARFCGRCGQPADAAGLTGTSIGKYKISAKLGEGGMGAVYAADDTNLRRSVALKLLKPELATSESLVKRFYAEARAAARIEHPNSVIIYDFGKTDDGALFIAMEHIKGASLRQLIGARGALPLNTALYIAEQVCSSLADAHAAGIVHRDLKPDNVMLTKRGKKDNIVKVLDFGIAKLRDDGRITKDPMTQAGDMLGTPQYMAPEQIRGDHVDGQADVYAMGCLLFEMVTGKLPFTGKTVMDILSQHLKDEPPVPSQFRADLLITPDIDRLILECLQKRPESRPASMETLGDRIADMRRALGVPTPHSVSTMTPVRRPGTENPALTPTGYAGPAGQNAGYAGPVGQDIALTPTGYAGPGGQNAGYAGPAGQDIALTPTGYAGQGPSGAPMHGQGTPATGSGPGQPLATPIPVGPAAAPHGAYPSSVPGQVAAARPTPSPASAFAQPLPTVQGRKSRGGRLALFVVIGLLALGGIGTGVYFAAFHGSGGPPVTEDDLPAIDAGLSTDASLPTDFDTKRELGDDDDPKTKEDGDSTVSPDFKTNPTRKIL